MLEFIFSLTTSGLQSVIVIYVLGAITTFLSWTKTIQEISSTAKSASGKRDKVLANSLRQSARDKYEEGLWAIPVWPLVILRNIRATLEVRDDYKKRKQAENKKSNPE